MNAKFNRMMKDESGITALETAIILIAFVVVAAIFAFTVLSTGTFLTERSKEAAYAGLQEVRGSMELKGGVVLQTISTGQYVTFNLATVAGGSSVDLSKVKMAYLDSTHNQDIAYQSGATVPLPVNQWIATSTDGSTAVQILTAGSLAHITVQPPAYVTHDWTFTLEIKPPTGAVLSIQRTTPSQIDTVTNLN